MGRECSICGHAERDVLDAAITAGTPYRRLRAQYGVSLSAISRHASRHLSPAWTGVEVLDEADDREPLPVRLERLLAYAETMFASAAAAGQGAQALAILKEMRGQLETIGRATGELDTRPVTVVNLQTSPEWLAVRAVILSALMAYPDARAAVSGRLLELEAGPS